ncbi:MAG: penicillin-binding protein 2 [Fuerstiella sp.]
MIDSNPVTQVSLKASSWRSKLVTCCIVVGWLVLMVRLIHLQAAQRQLLNHRVTRQSSFTEVLSARPGEILDRNGHVLAMTVTRDSLYAVPNEIEDPADFVWKVSQVLSIDAAALHERLVKYSTRQFLWVKRRVSPEESFGLRQLDLPKQTWGFRREYLRQYPQGAYAAHVLGIRDIDNVGHGGLEQSLDDLIRGSDGHRAMVRDARGLVMEVATEKSESPVHGQTVLCSLDLLLQVRVEQQLKQLVERWKPKGACVIVMEPRTGEVLAMASAPTFDPNAPGHVPENAWTNLAVSAVFEPGSTFKPFIVGWAIQQGMLQRDDVISCFNGAYRMGPRILHDHHSYSTLSVEDVLVKSSNIGMARIAERIGLGSLHSATVAFGFGTRTGIELPGEINGLVRDRKDWDEYSLGSIPMGHELAVTPLQLITAHAALANKGNLIRPHLLLSTSSETATPSPLADIKTVEAAPSLESRLIDSQIAEWLVEQPMTQVVERGTGKVARIDGVRVFGKTGTAQKVDATTGRYSNDRHVCSFLCGAPSDDPRVLVLVMVDEPTATGAHYGGTVAAPTARLILMDALSRSKHWDTQMTVRPEDDLPIRR